MSTVSVCTDRVDGVRFYVRYGKRLFDIVAAASALLVLSPALLILSVACRLFCGAPVLFKQVRAGLLGKPFTLYKFRSMADLRDASGLLVPDDQRLIAFGRVLRETSLDELPGLWNVLKGDISLIGPRPLPIEYTAFYTEEQAARLAVMPGMAGYAALFGRNAQSWEALFERDVWYSRNVSFLLDVRILFGVVGVVFGRKGINRGTCDSGSAFAEALDRRLHAVISSVSSRGSHADDRV